MSRRWRQSWLVSKRARYLRRQLDLFAAYRNWHRPRTNRDRAHLTPGVALGLVSRSLTIRELHSWRQDWQQLSIHPTSADGSSTVARTAA